MVFGLWPAAFHLHRVPISSARHARTDEALGEVTELEAAEPRRVLDGDVLDAVLVEGTVRERADFVLHFCFVLRQAGDEDRRIGASPFAISGEDAHGHPVT